MPLVGTLKRNAALNPGDELILEFDGKRVPAQMVSTGDTSSSKDVICGHFEIMPGHELPPGVLAAMAIFAHVKDVVAPCKEPSLLKHGRIRLLVQSG